MATEEVRNVLRQMDQMQAQWTLRRSAVRKEFDKLNQRISALEVQITALIAATTVPPASRRAKRT